MIDYLKDIEIFTDLSEDELASYEHFFRIRNYKKNHILMFENDDTEEIYFIKSGLLKIYRMHEDKEIILGIATPGDVIGETEALSDVEYRLSTVEALSDVSLLTISKKNFLLLIDEHSCILKRAYSVLASRTRLLNRLIRYLSFYDVRRKVANLIADFYYNFGNNEDGMLKIDMKINQSLFANMLGVSRESVSKTLNELQDEKIINFRGKYLHIIDKEKLFSMCDEAEEIQDLRKWK
ncbi:Crp/Fnr family transcriptional regulator [Enterococcus sp. BWR-S5]|uniref:Crp/Fnr family transcriptional regulator n=1 Tax=Enterococcus sp. BWR-S5 TaxID=2787714 RepID=UPI00192202E9|nr:Crp/Fnr family transcriptional regulator [Enterococcus sp. BWR-S5]MBL1225586.1 Crp/Fnr family transcriptional regulator [Enterococcus sp. BWR-S5]